MDYIITKKNEDNIKKLAEFLNKNKKNFTIDLEKKVDIFQYAKKVFDKGIVIIAVNNGIWEGCLTGYANDIKESKAYISIIVTNKDFQSKGIGKNLISIFENITYENEMKEIILYVHKDNCGAIKFYTREGFYLDKEKANYEYNITMKKIVSKRINILITSVGRRGYLVKYFKEALNGNVHVANSSDISPAFQYADFSIITPLIYDAKYIDFIIDYCKKNNINMVISLFDIDLPILAKNVKKFEENNIKLIVSNKEFIEICNDKWKTYQFLRQIKINVPKTYIRIDDVIKDIENTKLSFPIIIKPRWGMGSISILQAENNEELEVFYKKAKRDIFKSYLKYESNIDIDNCIIFQEKINGQEYGLDIINDLNGNYINTIIKEKIAMRSGETDCARVVENSVIDEIGNKISQASNHIANLDVDMFLVDDVPYVLEMNARFGGGYPFSHMAGVNLPKAIIDWCLGKEVKKETLIAQNNISSHKDINIVKI